MSVEQGGIRLMGPGPVGEGEAVEIRLLDFESAEQHSYKADVRRLIMLRLNKDIRYLRKNLLNLARMQLL